MTRDPKYVLFGRESSSLSNSGSLRPEFDWETRLGIQSMSNMVESSSQDPNCFETKSWLGNLTGGPKYVLFGRESSSQVPTVLRPKVSWEARLDRELALSWLAPLSEGVRCLKSNLIAIFQKRYFPNKGNLYALCF